MSLTTNTTGILCAAALSLTLLSSCKKAAQYYQKLHAQPEILQDYNAVYAIGDTVTLTGRLNPENALTIKVAGVGAMIISAQKVKPINRPFIDSSTTLDRVQFIITPEMGLGPDKGLEVISGGNSTNWPGFEIIESSSNGELPRSLQLVKHADLPFGAVTLYCINGKGNIYLWKKDNSLVRIASDGAQTMLADQTILKDDMGAFTITSFNAGGLDPQEQHLYFSAITTDGGADNQGNKIYRLCSYNLQTKILTTLNRTVISVNQPVLENYQPFEGSSQQVKLPKCQELIPDSKGNLYINIGNYAVAKLTASGSLKYLFRVQNSNDFPQIWNPVTNSYFYADDLNSRIPGIAIVGKPKAWDVEEGVLYCLHRSLNDLVQYDLDNQVTLYTLPAKYSKILYENAVPYISGSFSVLSGDYEVRSAAESGLKGYLPLPGEQLLILYYQGLDQFPAHKYYNQYPALGTRDFKNKRGRRYAPGKLIDNDFIMQGNDRMLNYDAAGMIYMTADQNTVIVKTKYQ